MEEGAITFEDITYLLLPCTDIHFRHYLSSVNALQGHDQLPCAPTPLIILLAGGEKEEKFLIMVDKFM